MLKVLTSNKMDREAKKGKGRKEKKQRPALSLWCCFDFLGC